MRTVPRRAIRDGFIVAGVIANAWIVMAVLPTLDLFIDAHAWASMDMNHLYGPEGALGLVGAFRYSPAAAVLFLPLSWLPWPVLVTLFTLVNVAVLIGMTGRRAWLFVLAFPPVLLELLNSNISILLAFAVWLGMRKPAAWAFVLLTKVTPGVGLVWFAVRREWRNLGIAMGVTVGIVLVGILVAPNLWLDWARLLLSASAVPTPGVPPLLLRLPVAALLTIYAAWTDRAWLVPVAAFLATPVLWLQGLAILTASFPLYWDRGRWQRTRRHPGSPVAAAPVIA